MVVRAVPEVQLCLAVLVRCSRSDVCACVAKRRVLTDSVCGKLDCFFPTADEPWWIEMHTGPDEYVGQVLKEFHGGEPQPRSSSSSSSSNSSSSSSSSSVASASHVDKRRRFSEAYVGKQTSNCIQCVKISYGNEHFHHCEL